MNPSSSSSMDSPTPVPPHSLDITKRMSLFDSLFGGMDVLDYVPWMGCDWLGENQSQVVEKVGDRLGKFVSCFMHSQNTCLDTHKVTTLL